MNDTPKQIILKLVVVLVVVATVFMPTGIIANAGTSNEIDDIDYEIAAIGQYFTVANNYTVVYDRNAAVEDGISDELLSFADEVYLFGLSQASDSEKVHVKTNKKSRSALNAKAVAFPVYGNWCGPGYGSGTPIDILDKGCKNHDLCYKNKGYHKCSCDKTFLSYVKNNYSKMTGAKQKSMAKIIQAWLTIKTEHVTKNGGSFSCKK